MLDVPVAETVRAKSVRVAWTQCSLSVSVDGEEVVGGPLSAAIRVDDDRCASPSLPPSRPPVACAAGPELTGFFVDLAKKTGGSIAPADLEEDHRPAHAGAWAHWPAEDDLETDHHAPHAQEGVENRETRI